MKKILISDSASAFSETLKGLGYTIRILRPSSRLPSAVADHADMLGFSLNGRLLLSRDYYESNRQTFEGADVELTEERFGNRYPHDILMNTFIHNGILYGNIPYISSKIKEYCDDNGIKMEFVKQGYTKCSTVITPAAAVTADCGIASALSRNGAEALIISPGSVLLDGYNYGFIGGASFYDDGNVYFFGDIKSHPDSDAIIEYFEKNGIGVISLSNGSLLDVGGAIII